MRLLFIILVGICCQLSAQEIKKVDSDVLFTCYKQGKSGDCVSVGITKAAICVFGINGVFKERIIDATHTEVTLKNGKKYTLLKEEFEMADTAMHIKLGKDGDQEIMRYAIKCFAVMAKVKQDLESIPTFEEAIHKLQHGAHGKKIFYDLGLENNVDVLDKTPDDVAAGSAWTKKHVVFVSNGSMDKYGKKVPLDPMYYGGLRLKP